MGRARLHFVRMFHLLLSCLILLLGSVCQSVEVDSVLRTVPIANSLNSSVTDRSDWVTLYQYKPRAAGYLEADLHISVRREGLAGSLLDFFSNLIPPSFDLAVVEADRVLFSQTLHSAEAAVGTTVKASGSTIEVLLRNRNQIFSLQAQVHGQIFAEADLFDLRKQFPNCSFPVYAQGRCGACYADVVAGSGSDAVCVETGKSISLSPQSIVSCARLGGCGGGAPFLAAQWAQHHGLWETSVCPYLSGTCDAGQDFQQNGCIACNAVTRSPPAESFRFRPVPMTPESELEMRDRIRGGGSVMVIFDAHTNFQEFFHAHPFGIYSDPAGTPSLGNHAVRLVGFGIEGELKFWVAVNSWGGAWGDRGTFRFVRGKNLCKIEQYPVGLEFVAKDVAVAAGVPENGAEIDSPRVGDWKQQDINNKYWTEEFTKKISLKIPMDEVKRIDTKVSHGFTVRLTTKEGKEIFIQVKPDGTEGTADHLVVLQ